VPVTAFGPALPRLLNWHIADGLFRQFTLATEAGISYVIDYTADVTSSIWFPLYQLQVRWHRASIVRIYRLRRASILPGASIGSINS